MSSCLCWSLYWSVEPKWDNFEQGATGYRRRVELDRSYYTGCEVVCTIGKGAGRIGSDFGLVVAVVVVVVGWTKCLRKEKSHNPSIRTWRRGAVRFRAGCLIWVLSVACTQQSSLIPGNYYIKASSWSRIKLLYE
jgi:hypothetical protein